MSDIGLQDDVQFGYRSINRMALAAFGVGLCSALALIGPLLWIVPAIAVGLGLQSMRVIAANPRQITGRSWAVIGTLLALFFGGVSITRFVSERAIIVAHARNCADHWLELIRHDQTHVAHQLNLRAKDRYKGPLELKQHYANEPHLRSGWQSFFDTSPLKEMLAAKGKFQFNYVGPVDQTESYNDLAVAVRYRVQYEADGQLRDIPVLIEVRRELRVAKPTERWRFTSLKLDVPQRLLASFGNG